MKIFNTSFYLFIILLIISSCGGSSPGDKMLDAASKGDIETIKSYLSQGVDINYQNSGFLYSEETACMKAAEKGQIKALEFLIEQGADFKKGNTGGENPISYAAKNGQFEAVMFLISKGEDVNYKEKNYGMTPFLSAAEYGDIKYMKKLISKGANIHEKSKSKQTAITLAAFGKKADAVKFLIKKGLNPNLKGQYGWTALTYAIFTSDYMKYDLPEDIKATVDVLLQGGADINQKDDDGNTVLIHAAQQEALMLIDYLLSKGANPDIKNNAGATYHDVLINSQE